MKYLFSPDWSSLKSPGIWLEALTQNAWDTGAAWGLILTYGAYMRKSDNITMSAFQTGVGNNLGSLVAAMSIFSTVFGTRGARIGGGGRLERGDGAGPA